MSTCRKLLSLDLLKDYYKALEVCIGRKVHQNQVKELRELDEWFRKGLVENLMAKEVPFVSRDELLKIVQWKLARGKYRPRLYKLVENNNEQSVRECSQKAFKVVGDGEQGHIRKGITELCKLKGLGPATASAILSAYSKDVPFMADEAVQKLCPGKSIKYTMKGYMEFVERVEDIKHPTLSPRDISHCLWVHKLLE